jgi:hypothetical protein
MSKDPSRPISKVLRDDPWEIEIAFYVRRGDISADDARAFTVMRYMEFDDLRPLRDAIAKATPIDDRMVAIDGAILGKLAELIDQGRLEVKQPHKSKSPDLFARDLVGALLYLKHPKESGSDAAFDEVAKELDMPVNALRDAVTRLRNARARQRERAKQL